MLSLVSFALTEGKTLKMKRLLARQKQAAEATENDKETLSRIKEIGDRRLGKIYGLSLVHGSPYQFSLLLTLGLLKNLATLYEFLSMLANSLLSESLSQNL